MDEDIKEAIRKIKVGIQYRSFPIERRQIDEAKRTVDLSFSSEEPVERFWGVEILDHDASSVNLRRLKRGGPLLIDHDMKKLVGAIEEVKIDESDRKGRARVRFGRSDTAKEIFNDVLDGIRSNVSVGYQINDVVLEQEKKGEPSVYRVKNWEPYEISLVSVPADITVGVGRGSQEGEKEIEIRIPKQTEERVEIPHKEERKMNKCEKCKGNLDENEKCPTCEAQRSIEAKVGDPAKLSAVEHEKRRIQAIRNLAELNSIDDQTRDGWIVQGYDIQQVSEDLLKIKAERSKNTPKTMIGLKEVEIQRYSLIKAIRASYEQKWDNAPFELECSRTIAQTLGKVVDPKRFYVPYEILERQTELHRQQGQRDISIATGGGAFLVGTQNLGFIEILRNRSVAFRMGATRLTGLVGNVTIPKQTASATAYWLASESTSITESQQTFVQVGLSPHTCGAYTEISRQLLLQSSPGAEGIVSDDLARIVATAVDLGVIKGSGGGGEPKGIINTTGIGSVTGTSLAAAGIIEFQTDVAGANVMPMIPGYVTTSAVAGLLMVRPELPTTGTTRLWIGNIWDGTMFGLRAMSSEQMPSATMLFGDWSSIVVGEWGVLEVEVNPYASFAAGIIGVRAFYTMDVAMRIPAAFSYANTIT
jgi:HK97 family phage major capsid protein/HK97 family phage prohead protease